MSRLGAAVFGFTSAVGQSVSSSVQMLFASGRAGWSLLMARSRFDYRREVGDPMGNSAVAAVIGWIARNFPEAPVQIVREPETPGAPPTVIRRSATGPGAMLNLLERPNPWYSGVILWMATIVDRYVTGDGYWIKERDGSGRVRRLWYAPAMLMEPRWPQDDPTVFISHYEYAYESGKIWKLSPSDVVHFRDGIDPRNVRKGRSRFASLFREIFTDDEASNFTASLLRNLGVPGVIIAPANTSGSGGRITKPEEVKSAFMEKFGGDRRGEPLVMTAPTDVKVLSFNPQQMELRDLRKLPEERISGVVGVAAVVAGLGAGLDRSTFTNFGEARKAAYQEAIIPDQRGVAAELELQLLDEFADLESDPLDVRFDWTQASAMQEAWNEVWRRAESAARSGLITVQDFQRTTGQPVDQGPEVYLRPLATLEVPKGEPRPATSDAAAFAAISARNEGRYASHHPASTNGHKPGLIPELAGVST
jgi:HK97 family phage portal protein